MDKTSAIPTRSPTHVPLARDANGTPIVLPEDAAGWRIRRQTGGRPRLVLDGTRQPMVFPLHYTVQDAEDILAPGNYRLDVVDKGGELLDITVPLSVGGHRNAEPSEPEETTAGGSAAAVPTSLPSSVSDTRLVLEANIRSTQMAFLHNERTLALGLRTAETLRESVQALASSQAEWITAISSARGFFRNAPAQLAAPAVPAQVSASTAPKKDDEDEDDDEEEDDGDEVAAAAVAEPLTLRQQLEPVIGIAVKQAVEGILEWIAKPRDPKAPGGGFKLEDFLFWGRSKKRAKAAADEKAATEPATAAKPAAAQATARSSASEREEPAAAPPGGSILGSLPPEVVAKLMQVRPLLSLDEQVDAMRLVQRIPHEDLVAMLPTFLATPSEDLAEFLRDQVAAWRKQAAEPTAKAPAEPAKSGESKE